MTPLRPRLWLPAVLVLALFCSWLGTALAHEHAPDPTCQFCKVVHNSPADLVRRSPGSEPARVAERLVSLPTSTILAPDLVVPQGRAPPAS